MTSLSDADRAPLQVLVVEDDAGDFALVETALADHLIPLDFERVVAEIRNFFGHTVTLPWRLSDTSQLEGSTDAAATPTSSDSFT